VGDMAFVHLSWDNDGAPPTLRRALAPEKVRGILVHLEIGMKLLASGCKLC
jgi:hypothetical protein